jgi:putative membrane protein
MNSAGNVHEDRPATPDELRTFLAGQRTLLAWVRTAIALSGFGFVVARFGLFLRELSGVPELEMQPPSEFSLWVGIVLVVLGAAVHLFAAAQYAQFLRRFRCNELAKLSRSWFEIGLSVLLAGLGAALVVYLVGLRAESPPLMS